MRRPRAASAAVAIAAVLVAVLVAACNFDDTFQIDLGVDPGRPGSAFREVCAERAVASCAYQARCSAWLFEWEWAEEAPCIERTTLACQLRAADPHTLLDEGYLRDCKIPAAFPCSSDAAYEAAVVDFLERCPSRQGDLPEGSSCSVNAACEDGNCQTHDGFANHPTACGVCRANPCAQCEADERCSYLTVDVVECTPVFPDGAACAEGDDCVSGRCKDGACAPRPKEGEACDPTEPTGCVGDGAFVYCNATEQRCERVTLAKVGEPCGYVATGAVCGGAGTICVDGVCGAPAADGAPCDLAQGVWCLTPADCIDGFCRFRDPACSSED